jgi:hypothetical protein
MALTEYGMPPAAAEPLPKEVLEQILEDILAREAEIQALQQRGVASEYQLSELKQEAALLAEKKAETQRLLQPPKPAAAVVDNRDWRRAEHEKFLAALEVSEEELARRAADRAEHRARAIEFSYREQKEVLLWNIAREEAAGEYRQASLLRNQLMGLREQIERSIR